MANQFNVNINRDPLPQVGAEAEAAQLFKSVFKAGADMQTAPDLIANDDFRDHCNNLRMRLCPLAPINAGGGAPAEAAQMPVALLLGIQEQIQQLGNNLNQQIDQVSEQFNTTLNQRLTATNRRLRALRRLARASAKLAYESALQGSRTFNSRHGALGKQEIDWPPNRDMADLPNAPRTVTELNGLNGARCNAIIQHYDIQLPAGATVNQKKNAIKTFIGWPIAQ